MSFLGRVLVIGIFIGGCPSLVMAAGGYVDNQDGTISEPKHSLMWQKGDDAIQRSWREAVEYCKSLELAGHRDWTLPKAYQLTGLIDMAFSPTIDPLFTVKPSYYWSATLSETGDDSAKYVNFFYGNTYTFSKDNPYYVLCVRETVGSAPQGLAAAITGAPVRGKDLVVHFMATMTGGSEPYFYEWDFGDGGTSSAAGPSHAFAQEGHYQVMLTVSDNDGAIAVSKQEITLPLADTPTVDADGSAAGKPVAKAEEALPVPAEGVAVASAREVKLVGAKAPGREGQEGASSTAGGGSPAGGGPQGVMEVLASGGGTRQDTLGHGPLADAFAKAIAGDADANADDSVSSRELQVYIEQAVKGRAKGQPGPVVVSMGEEFPLCSAQGGSTYAMTIGVNHDPAGKVLAAVQDAEFVRKAVEDKCPRTKTMMLKADHANRQDILQALVQIRSMITAADTLLVYVGASGVGEAGRLAWYVNDSQPELPTLTGINHEELVSVLKTLPMRHLLVLGEKN